MASSTGHGLQDLLTSRLSVKSYAERALTRQTLMSALATVAGTTGTGHRSTPSPRASYPIAVTVIAARVDGVEAGCMAQDGYLWAADQGLGTGLIAGLIAGLDDVRAEQVTSGLIPAGHDLLAILPLGTRAED